MIFISLFFCVIVGLIGISGLFLNKSNLIQVLISFEVVVLSIILCLSFSSEISLSVYPVVLSILVTVSSATEVAIGLILIILYHKINGSISSKFYIQL